MPKMYCMSCFARPCIQNHASILQAGSRSGDERLNGRIEWI
jgi:hypothetical protein